MVNKNKTEINSALIKTKIMSFEDVGLSKDSKGASSFAFALSVRALLNSWRQGTVGCKGRADVAKSGKKPWKQKGTGRARAGDAASPIWRGGGVIHGPQPRVRVLKVAKKVRITVFSSLLNSYVKNERIISVDWTMQGDKPQTKMAHNMLVATQMYAHKKVILFLLPEDRVHYASFANLKNVQPVFFDQPNVFHLAHADRWIFLQKDVEQFKQMVSKWV